MIDITSLCQYTHQYADDIGAMIDIDSLNSSDEFHSIDCRGAYMMHSEIWSGLGFRAAFGENAIIEVTHTLNAPLQSHGWTLIPIDQHQLWVGSTYRWDIDDCEQRYDTSSELEEAISQLAKKQLFDSNWTIKHIKSGIRPIIEGRLPVFGPHPYLKRQWTINGLGSKGTAWAPYVVDQFMTLFETNVCAHPKRLPKANWRNEHKKV